MKLKHKREETQGLSSLDLNFYPKCPRIGIFLLGQGGDPHLGPLLSFLTARH